MENCPGLVAGPAAARHPGGVPLAALASDQVRITYIGHSTLLIESPRGVKIATDYNDYVRPPVLPDIVTMNRAHSTHYTDIPIPASSTCCAAGTRGRAAGEHDLTGRRRARAQRADQHPRLAAAAPSGTAIRSSSSRSRACASPISAICITR